MFDLSGSTFHAYPKSTCKLIFMLFFPFREEIVQYSRMKFNKILKELDSEEKARTWVWLAKFDGKTFICPKCQHEQFYQHTKSPEIRECKSCHFEVRLRARTIFQNSKIPMLLWLKAIGLMTQGKRGISALELQSELEMKS